MCVCVCVCVCAKSKHNVMLVGTNQTDSSYWHGILSHSNVNHVHFGAGCSEVTNVYDSVTNQPHT